MPQNLCPYLRAALIYGPARWVWALLAVSREFKGVTIYIVPTALIAGLIGGLIAAFPSEVGLLAAIGAGVAYLVSGYFVGMWVADEVFELRGKHQGRIYDFVTRKHDTAWAAVAFLCLPAIIAMAAAVVTGLLLVLVLIYLFDRDELCLQRKLWRAINIHPRKVVWLRPTLLLLVPIGWLAWEFSGLAIKIAVVTTIAALALGGLYALFYWVEKSREKREAREYQVQEELLMLGEARRLNRMFDLLNHTHFREWLAASMHSDAVHLRDRGITIETPVKEIVTRFSIWLLQDLESAYILEVYGEAQQVEHVEVRQKWVRMKSFASNATELFRAIVGLILALDRATICPRVVIHGVDNETIEVDATKQ